MSKDKSTAGPASGNPAREAGQGESSGPSAPIGDASPRASWPAVVTGVLWFGWIVVLLFIAIDVQRGV